eukprot:gene17123-18844_t
MADATTPIKVYGSVVSNNCCRLCGLNFGESNKKPAFQLFTQKRLSSDKEDFMKKLKRVCSVVDGSVPSDSRNECVLVDSPFLSSVGCKTCHSKVIKFDKTLGEIKLFRDGVATMQKFSTNETEGNTRHKRCSSSPHDSGPQFKMLLLPIKMTRRSILPGNADGNLPALNENVPPFPFKHCEVPHPPGKKENLDRLSSNIEIQINYSCGPKKIELLNEGISSIIKSFATGNLGAAIKKIGTTIECQDHLNHWLEDQILNETSKVVSSKNTSILAKTKPSDLLNITTMDINNEIRASCPTIYRVLKCMKFHDVKKRELLMGFRKIQALQML